MAAEKKSRTRVASITNNASSIKLPPLPSSLSAPGPASTPRIEHEPPPFSLDQLASMLDQEQDDRHLRPHIKRSGSSNSGLRCDYAESAGEDDVDEEHDQSTTVEVVNYEMMYWGYGFVITCTTCFILGTWSMFIAPFVGPYNNKILDAMANDTHYKYLFVLLVPVTLYTVIINWWGLKVSRV
ncbi:BZ3500_MvSof-1268-A1-R1_Chr7-3g09640 [Microbotryum saponariae]|uniref:BZ3500_MvSof-1268-A1-R1_Chr7-3g09640 protein n=1 Tax=Microbotryum saponariae TaxID=289078 RepID=A0A2X0MYJ6_9BASI|nr:BZ3501_MvSof-1269-A2-R1_Chr7-2g09363 [Microbotryum saponariae]SDA02328.1 BZ3500_MvSof-1268-A1-R1_Chr7-3g09640 [Microbotryum saponariae]